MKITNAILCEDCRVERSGKNILLGIFVGDVLVTQFPAALVVMFWIQIDGLKAGDHNFEFRVKLENKIIAEASFSAGLKTNGLMTLPIGPIPLEFIKGGKLKFDIKKSEGKWQNAVEKEIRLVQDQ